MHLQKKKCFLLRPHLFLSILLFLSFILFAVNKTESNTPPAVISGRVVKYVSPDQGLAGIQITAYNPVGVTPIEQAVTDDNGYYTLSLNLSQWQEIYLCAQDSQNRYVTECYDENYWLYSETGWGRGDKIGIGPNQRITKNFKLCQGGSIPVTLDLPPKHGCVIFLEGMVDYKAKTSMVFPPGDSPWRRVFSEQNQVHYSLDLADYVLEPSSKEPLPPGNYKVWVEDNAQMYYDLEISNPYCTYSIDLDYPLLPQYATAVISCDNPSAEPISFGSFEKAGIIYGLITDPNTKEVTSHLFHVVTDGWHGQSDLVINRDPNHLDPANPQITFLTEKDSVAQGIKGIQAEIIPLNNEQVESPVIPSRVMDTADPDPNQLGIYHTGRYGGYAFKFLEPGEYKIRIFSRVGSTDAFSTFYGAANGGEVIHLGEGEAKQIDFVLKETSIWGKVSVQGGDLSNVSVSLLTSAHEQICFTMANSSTGGFSFHRLVSGNLVVRFDKPGYGVEERSLGDLQLGEQRNVGTINLTPFEPCQGTGQIYGRIYLDDDPNVGLANITVHAMDINHIGQSPCSALTDAQGNFTISGLPNSGFIVYTHYDPQQVTGGYFNEMYNNVIAFSQPETWCEWEMKHLSKVLQDIDPSHMDDPNILITPVYLTQGGTQEINIGLSNYNFAFSAGLNLFAYPGTPLKSCDTSEEFLKFFTHGINSRLSLGNGADVMYRDPIDGSFKGNNFAIKSGRGYIFYSSKDVPLLRLPPFTISPPPPIELGCGRQIICVPDGADKGFHAEDVLRTFGNDGKTASVNSAAISHFDPRQGKWRSSTWLWGECAGDNFKIERARGYLVDIKKPIIWSRK